MKLLWGYGCAAVMFRKNMGYNNLSGQQIGILNVVDQLGEGQSGEPHPRLPYIKRFAKNCQLDCANGDFNSPAGERSRGYDMVCADGWQDSYEAAVRRDEGYTVEKVIDGWRERTSARGMRLDYIFSSRPERATKSKVICNGVNYDVVSDHYGVMIETEH